MIIKELARASPHHSTRGRKSAEPTLPPPLSFPQSSKSGLILSDPILFSSTSSPGLFPQKMGAPPIFWGKSPGDEVVSSPGLGLVPGESDSPHLIIMSLITIPTVEYFTIINATMRVASRCADCHGYLPCCLAAPFPWPGTFPTPIYWRGV